MEHNIFLLMISLNCCICCCYGQDSIRMTTLSIKHFASEDDTGVIHCRMTPEVNNENEYNVESLRTGNTRAESQNPNLNPDPPQPVYNGGSHPHYRINMQNNGNDDAFGVFGCNATKDGWKETVISTTRMRSDADIVPSNDLFTQTVSIGDTDVSISMRIRATDFQVDELRWRNNTYFWGDTEGPSFGSDTFEIDEPIELYHAGIYECHRQGDRSSAKHGLNLLIVRACPHTRWGPPDCEGVCDSCHNGGVCDENTGQCVCPPGFSGTNCLTACGGNRYGYNCEQRCSYNSDPKDKCGGTLFCLVEPFGCRCNTGFGGLACNTQCGVNTFGASCLQSCHCVSNQCNQFTGECEGTDTSCDPGWTGTYCQECVDGYFGSSCDQECHCSSDKCNMDSGLCKTGGCLPQWADRFPPYSCQTGLESATTTKVNSGAPVSVNCTAVQGPGEDLSVFKIVLSKSADDLDESDITLDETFNSGAGETGFFTVRGLTQDVTLYCHMRDQSDQRVAVLAVTVTFYAVLPKLNQPPEFAGRTSTSITVRWEAWNSVSDIGTPPIVGYIVYYKLSSAMEWSHGVSHNESGESFYFATVEMLYPDTMYDFSVAAVREGYGGEGEKSQPLRKRRTTCDSPLVGPQDVYTTVSGEKQELVEVFWKLPPEEQIRCSEGLLLYNIYYSSMSNSEGVVTVSNTSANSYIVEDLERGVNYQFVMTLSTEGGESSESNLAQQFTPVLPEMSTSPTLVSKSMTTVTISWTAWDKTTDIGTPPIVTYNLYYKMSIDLEWNDAISYDVADGQSTYSATVEDLIPHTLYDFSVAAARVGYGGEGPKSPSLEVETVENETSPVPSYVIVISVGVPVVIIIVGALIFFKRYRGRQSETNVDKEPTKSKGKGTTATNYENAGFGGVDEYDSVEHDYQKIEDSYQDLNINQQYETVIGEPTGYEGYEIPTCNNSGKGSDETPFETPMCE